MTHERLFAAASTSFLLLLCLTGCIRPKYERFDSQQHTPLPPVLLSFKADDPKYGQGYFKTRTAYEAYVEFDQRGALYTDDFGRNPQLDQALELIHRCRFRVEKDTCDTTSNDPNAEPKPVRLFVFVHGWKNNASDDTNNPWGFRRFLSEAAYLSGPGPVIGIYIGWPGASLKGDLFLSFWNREPVAEIVGNSNALRITLKKLLHEAKGDVQPGSALGEDPVDSSTTYGLKCAADLKAAEADHRTCEERSSTAVVIGHSFGGIVLEHAATALMIETYKSLKPDDDGTYHVTPPANLFVLVNEAGASAIAKPFLDQLQQANVSYTCTTPYPSGDSRRVAHQIRPRDNCPLFLSMTSEGDFLTKLAYPGGEALSFNRPASHVIDPPDRWGQKSTKPYDLLTTANFNALQNYAVVPQPDVNQCYISASIPGKKKVFYCMTPIGGALNTTPYWVMQLPQYFVPDHGTVFQASFLQLLIEAARGRDFMLTVPPAGRNALRAP